MQSPEGTWVSSYGVNDPATKAPMGDDKFQRIGSVTKTFTGTLVLQLAQDGKLALDNPIERYVPGMPNGANITLRGVTYNQMVVNQLREEDTDRLFQAFSDATRRDIVRRVTVAKYSVSGLAKHYNMSFAAVQKHVAVLERASLVTKVKHGREQLVQGNHEGLRKARRLLDEYEVIWRQRDERIADILAHE